MTTSDALSDLLPPDALALEEYAAPALGRPPEAVVRPSSVGDVAKLLAWASREGVGVLPVASGRRAEPVGRDGRYVALATDRLAGIEEYEAADLTITAGAGTPLPTIAETLAENRQWAPFDPPHANGRSLGGLVATGESGALRTGYGDLRHHVLGMTVVTGDGRTLDLGGKVVKNVAGYDLVKAVVGSRGTLAVIASVCLRAFPRPAVDRVLVRSGSSLAELVAIGLEAGTAPILPASCVVVDRLEATGGSPAVVVRLHGAARTVDTEQGRLEDHLGVPLETWADVGAEAGASQDPSGRASALLEAVRDHASDHEAVIHASALPSRLLGVLDALEALEPDAVAVDTYSGFVRAGVDPARLDGGLADTRAAVERLGGAVRVDVSGALGAYPAASGSHPSEGEALLIERLRSAFDPEGVLWPARR